MWRWLLKRIGGKTLFLIVLLLFTVSSVGLGLSNVVEGLDFSFLLFVLVTGCLVAWQFALWPVSGRFAGMLGTLFGFEIVLLRGGRLGGFVWGVVITLLQLLWRVYMWGWTRLQPDIANVPHASLTLADVQPLWDAIVQLRDSMSVLISRTWTWLTSFLSANPVFDPIGTSLVWGFIMWLLAFWAGWAVARRKQPLLAIVPAGVVLLAVMSYAGEPPSILFPLMGSSFLLMAMEKQHGRELRWDLTHVDFSRDLWTDTLMFASVLTFVLLSVSAITPAISAQKIVDFVDKLTPARSGEGEAVAGSFGVQQAPPVERKVPTSIDRMRMTGLPRSHLIGSGPELSQEVVMIVRTRELPAVPDESLLPSLPVNYYWRSLVYDVYTGRGWRTSDTNDKEYEAGDLVYGMPESIPPYQRYLRQEVQAVDELGGLIHIAGSLVAIDETYKVSWRTQRDMFGGVVSLPSYYATSLVTEIGEDELRLVQPTYPFWVQQRYLQLPDNLPARVSELAHDLTVTELTLYDRAVAIERYLRQYPYTLDVEYPPSNRDMVDYFLFDLQKGYCDYYATAMVVLARAAGLPARLVIGYAGGTYEATNARYVLAESNAHAWPEIYFPEIGWIEFEPTAALMQFDRSAEDEELIWPEELRESSERPIPPLPTPDVVVWPWILGGIAGLVVFSGGLLGLDLLRLSRMSPDALVCVLLGRLRFYARRLYVPSVDGHTPYEFAAAFEERIDEIVKGRKRGVGLLLPAKDGVQRLVALYIRQLYSPEPIGKEERRQMLTLWPRLRLRLWLARLWRKVRVET